MSERIYIAGPFSTEQERESLKKMISLVRQNFPYAKLYIPMEFKVPGEFQKPDGSWNLENYDWARQVYLNDLKHIEEATKMFAMYTGRNATTGTAWEIGYACAYGIDTYLYIPEWAKEKDMSLMIINSALGWMDEFGVIRYVNEDFFKMFKQK